MLMALMMDNSLAEGMLMVLALQDGLVGGSFVGSADGGLDVAACRMTARGGLVWAV